MKLPLIIQFIVFLFFIRGLIIILHELGHAIPAILLTKEKVSIYLGSYGDQKKSVNFKIGLLDVWINHKFFSWKNGLCIPSAKDISINQRIIYTLFGPLFPFIISTLFIYYAYSKELNDSYLLFSVIFFVSSIFDLFRNLTPNKNPIVLHNNKTTYNDGYTLIQLYKYKKFPKEYKEAIDLYTNKEYEKSIKLFDYLLNLNIKDENIFRLNMTANIFLQKNERAKALFDEFEEKFKLTSDDYCNGGLIYCRLDLNGKALDIYEKSLKLNPNNSYTLNNKGFTLNLLEKYREAIPIFDKAITINPDFAYSYNNRGLSKIKTGLINEGLADIEKSTELDENNSYIYRNLGIYHFDLGEIDKARELFLKSKALDNETYKIDELIASTNLL